MKAFKKELLKEWWKNSLDYLPLGAKFRGEWQKAAVTRIIKEIDERIKDIEISEKIFKFKVKVGEETEYHEYGGQTEYPQLQQLIEVIKGGSWNGTNFGVYEALPNYSTDLKDAWKIVKYLQKQGYDISCTESNHMREKWLSYCKISKNQKDYVLGRADNIPQAICEAALKLVENESN